MTKEQVINTLNSLKQYYNDKNEDSYVGFDAEDNEALDMAIKALEQTEWIPCSKGLPEDVTNGDMIKAVFPNVEIKEKNNGYEVYFGIGTAVQFFNRKWWNTPYNAESEE